MPVYQYACTECGDQLEVRQKFTDDALTVCPACEGRLRKVLSAVGVVFKGSGFYRNDSRSTPNGEPASTSTSSDGKGSTSGDSSTSDSSTSDSSTSGSSTSEKAKGSSEKKTSPAAAAS